MKIGQQKTPPSTPIRGWLFVLLFTFALGLYLGEQNTWQRLQTRLSALPAFFLTSSSPLPTLTVDMRFDNYTRLVDQRNQALADGVYIPQNNDFITATVRLNNDTIPIRLRLQPGTNDHLGDDEKWNLEGRTRQDTLLLGTTRFFLLDPADNAWLNQWAFSQTLQDAGILATSIQFVRLILNGTDHGIYTFIEGFGDELMLDQGRTPGVLFEFDADLLWESAAYFGNIDAALADPITNLSLTNFQSFNADAFNEEDVRVDDIRNSQRLSGIAALRALQNNTLTPSAIFDLDQYARFLAIVDLWGATDSLNLTNLRFYYNPNSSRLEPVGFAGNPQPQRPDRIPLTATYNDPALQSAYLRAVQEISQPDYLASLETNLHNQWQQWQSALQEENNTLSPPWSTLANRQEKMRLSLNPAQPVNALLIDTPVGSDFILIDVANLINLPLEIVGFDIGGATFLEADDEWIQTGHDTLTLPAINTNAPLLQYTRFALPLRTILAQDNEIDWNRPVDIQVATRIVGLDNIQYTLVRQ